MTLELGAALAGAITAAGVILGVIGAAGTARPARPPSTLARWLERQWRSPGRSHRQQRAHQSRIIGTAGAAAAGWLLTGWPAAGLIIALAVPGIPWLVSAGSAERAAIGRLEALESWTRRLADIVARGIGLQQAIVATASTPPRLIETAVRDLAARLQADAEPRTALRRFADDIDDYTCDQVVAPLLLHLNDRGAGLPDVLTDICRAIAAEIEARSTVDAKRAGPRFAVRFLTGMTLALLAYGLASPGYLQPYGTLPGQLVLLLLTALYALLMGWVRALSVPPTRPRLLRTDTEARQASVASPAGRQP